MKGKFIKKLTAYALAAAMVVSTPMTASAVEFADNFYQSTGNDEDTTHTDTGTVSSTDTETNTTVLRDYAAAITGIRISPASVVMNAGTSETLVAEVLYAEGSVPTDPQKELINKTIRWESSNRDVVTVNAKKNSMNICPINGNKAGFSTVTASLDYDYDGTPDIIARVNVMVKRNFTKDSKIVLNTDGKKFYAGHTYELYKFVTIDDEPALASDDIAYTITFSDKKLAKKSSVNGDGVLSVDKSLQSPVKATLTAVYQSKDLDLKSDPKTITLELGVPVTKLDASDKGKVQIDLDKMYEKNNAGKYTVTKPDAKKASVTVSITNKTKGKTTTDDFTWASADTKIAKVVNTAETLDDTKEFKTGLSADIIGVGVGKTKITVTSTSGKKATFNVTVNAKLLDIESVYIAGGSTWSGKTTPVIVDRVPAENNDKLKLEVNKTVMPKDKQNLIKFKNQNVIPAADLKGNATIEATITVKSKNFSKDHISKDGTFTVKQSNVTFDGVARAKVTGKDENGNLLNPGNLALGAGTDITTLKQPSERLNPSARTVKYYAINPKSLTEGVSTADAIDSISWESSSEKIATVENGKVKVVGEGNATITVSCVSTMKWNKNGGWKDNKNKYTQTKRTFRIKSTPKCTDIVLKDSSVAGTAGSKVTISVKQQLPKKAADAITWYIDKDGKGYVEATKAGISKKDATDKKLTYMLSGVEPGTTIKVLATTGSVSTEATIEVVSAKIKKVTVQDSKGMSLKVGEMKIIGDNRAADGTADPNKKVDFTILSDNREKIAGYTVDKNGATAVKVLKLNDGRAIVCGISEGKGTINAITSSGKKAGVKVTVSGTLSSGGEKPGTPESSSESASTPESSATTESSATSESGATESSKTPESSEATSSTAK